MSARAFFACVGITVIVVFLTLATGFRTPPAARGAAAAASDTPPAPVPYSETDYRLGVFPFLPALTLDRLFSLVVDDLGKGIGRTVHFRTKPNFEAFAEAMGSGTYDFIFVHPFFYVSAADNHGYVAMTRLREPLVVAVLAREEAALDSLSDLAGRTLGLPPKLAAVSEIMFGELEMRGMAPGRDPEIRHFQSKMSCLHAVVLGTIDACGLPQFALAHLKLSRSDELKVVHQSAAFPSLVFAAHPRVPASERKRVAELIVGWEAAPGGQEILAAAKWSGFVAARDEDYDQVRLFGRQRHAFSLRR